MSDFKLSVITINRNNAEGLRKTIESVLSQPNLSQENFEYIIVDGASTDNSVEVIKEFESRTDLPLKITSWTSEPDTGIYNAMNKGIKKATGTLVGIMNSGDEFLPNAFDGLEELAENNPNAVLYGAVAGYRNGRYHHTYGFSSSELPHGITIPHNASFVPIVLYKRFGLYDDTLKICADYDFFSKLFTNKIEFVWLEKLICNYDLDGISGTQRKLLNSEMKTITKKYNFYKEVSKQVNIKTKILFWTKRIIKASIFFILGIMVAVLFFLFTRQGNM